MESLKMFSEKKIESGTIYKNDYGKLVSPGASLSEGDIELKIDEMMPLFEYLTSSSGSEPEYGSDEYVDRWDQSQQSDNDDWAYLHDQPVKTENGHEYKRMYDEELY